MENKNIDAKILFVEPYRIGGNEFDMPGIAYLRGFLKSKGIESDVINFNQLFYNNKKTIDHDCISYIKKCVNKNKTSMDSNNQSAFNIINNFFNLKQKTIIKAIEEMDIFQNYFQEELPKLLKYKYVGISVTFNTHLLFALILANFIKKNKNHIKIILGGPMITFFYDDLIMLQKNNQLIDYLIIGEGETPIWKIIEQSHPSKVPNLIYLKKGLYKKSQNLNHIEDIKKLPSPIFDNDDIIIYLQTTRKCYWGKCAHCTLDKNKFVKYPETKSSEKIIKYISKINFQKNQEKYFIFTDNSLPVNFLKKFSQKIINRGLKYNFEAFMRAEKTLNREILQTAKRAGFSRLKFGVETFNPRLSKLLNRGVDTKKIFELIKICFDLKINVYLYFMIGLPTQTKEELEEDFNQILSVAKEYSSIIEKLQILLFRLETGSDIYNNPKKYKIKILHEQKKRFNRLVSFKQLNKNAISSEEAIKMHKIFYKKNHHILKDIYGTKPFYTRDEL